MTTLAVTRRKQLPFGETRSTQTETIPGTRGFVGGTNDPTGLVHLGAREYDPTLGRFLSVDPVIDLDDPAQMNAYSYAHNNPVTMSDPDGLRPDGPAGGASYNDDRWGQDRGMSVGYTLKNGHWVWHQTPLKDKESRKRYAAYRANPSTYKVYHYNALEVARAKAQAEAKRKAADLLRRREEAVRAQIESGQGFRLPKGQSSPLGEILKGNFGKAWDLLKNGDCEPGPVMCEPATGTFVGPGGPMGEAGAGARGPWQLTPEGSTKMMRGGPFKTTFYQSRSDGTWWTPDVTGHGGSAFKVYRQTSKGLEWIADADLYGDYMPGKWKGDTGKFIPKSQLKGVKR